MSLKTIRQSKILTQGELAQECGLSVRQIIRLELGESMARPSTIRKLAKGLRVSVSKIQAAIADKGSDAC